MPRRIEVTPLSEPGAGETIDTESYRLLESDGTTEVSTADPPWNNVSDDHLIVEKTVMQVGDPTPYVDTFDVAARVLDLAALADGANAIDLTWTPSPGAAAHDVHASATADFAPDVDTNTTRIAELGAAADEYKHEGLDPETTRYYKIIARSASGLTTNGNEASATTDAAAGGEAPTVTLVPQFTASGTDHTEPLAAAVPADRTILFPMFTANIADALQVYSRVRLTAAGDGIQARRNNGTTDAQVMAYMLTFPEGAGVTVVRGSATVPIASAGNAKVSVGVPATIPGRRLVLYTVQAANRTELFVTHEWTANDLLTFFHDRAQAAETTHIDYQVCYLPEGALVQELPEFTSSATSGPAAIPATVDRGESLVIMNSVAINSSAPNPDRTLINGQINAAGTAVDWATGGGSGASKRFNVQVLSWPGVISVEHTPITIAAASAAQTEDHNGASIERAVPVLGGTYQTAGAATTGVTTNYRDGHGLLTLTGTQITATRVSDNNNTTNLVAQLVRFL